MRVLALMIFLASCETAGQQPQCKHDCHQTITHTNGGLALPGTKRE